MVHERIAARLTLAIAAALAGCGGSSPPAPEAPPSAPPGASASLEAPLPADVPVVALAPDAATAGEAPVTPLPPLPAPPGGAEPAPLAWSVPAGWIEDEPTSPMRRAQYRLPGPDGDAALVVFYFGPGQGGDAMANAERWIAQFRKADGTMLGNDDVVLSDRLAGETPMLVVEAQGTFVGSAMPGRPQTPPRPDHMLLGAVVRGPDANWFFKALGPAATLEAHRAAFEELLASIR